MCFDFLVSLCASFMNRPNANTKQAKTFNMDGGADFRHHFGLSGEEQAPQVIVVKDGKEMNVSELAAHNVAKRVYQKQYMDYWNSTADLTGTGRPVDGLFCPLAPHAAVIPTQYESVGYTGFVNVLDYTSLAIPVTFADKTVDVRPADGSADGLEYIKWDCELTPCFACLVHADCCIDDAETYDGAPVGVQFVGRRLQEEKMLTLAEYLGEEIARDAKGSA
jgi:amidase